MAYGDAREALLIAGVALLREGGYEHAGTNAILERAGVPRGSFYHHFENKHQFVLAVAARWYEDGAFAFEPYLTDETRPPLARLQDYFRALIDAYVQESCKCGCLLGMLGQELSGHDEAARGALTTLFQRWRDSLTTCLYAAQVSGDLDASESPEQLSAFIINAWEGALIQMKTQRSDAPLNNFMDIVFRKVLRS